MQKHIVVCFNDRSYVSFESYLEHVPFNDSTPAEGLMKHAYYGSWLSSYIHYIIATYTNHAIPIDSINNGVDLLIVGNTVKPFKTPDWHKSLNSYPDASYFESICNILARTAFDSHNGIYGDVIKRYNYLDEWHRGHISSHGRYVNNLDAHEYIDCLETTPQEMGFDSDMNPVPSKYLYQLVPLLSVCNDFTPDSGDYTGYMDGATQVIHGKNYVGAWAGDRLALTDKPVKDYRKITPRFTQCKSLNQNITTMGLLRKRFPTIMKGDS